MKSTQNTSLGKILVSSTGKTLYHFASEPKNAVKCTGSCATQWPPLLIGTGVTPVAAPGVTASLLGTVKRPDGKLQVTYRGLALYLYSGDKKAGDVKGQGGSWHAIAPSGVGRDEGRDHDGHDRRLRFELRLRLDRLARARAAARARPAAPARGGGGGGTGTNDPNANCDTNPGAYGCM